MDFFKLKPAIKDYIWGGNKLKEWGKQTDLKRIAECWELSAHADGASLIDGGEFDGKKLSEVISKSDWGENCLDFEFFPVLIKLIDAADNLSVQVHPSDETALKNEGQFGKTEMWYVVDAEPNSGLYCGFKEDITKEAFIESAKKGTVLDKLNFFLVKKGDCFFIEAGTVHAIGKGVTILEVQQNSNLTYRIFDYFRVGADGKPRELHLDKAAEVINLKKYKPYQGDVKSNEVKGGDNQSDSQCGDSQSDINQSGNNNQCGKTIAKCKYFNVSELKLNGAITLGQRDTFVSFTVIDGKVSMGDVLFKRGDTCFIKANGSEKLVGEATLIVTKVC